MRVWQWLSRQGLGSRQQVLAQFAALEVQVNGQAASPLTLLQLGDHVSWLPAHSSAHARAAHNIQTPREHHIITPHAPRVEPVLWLWHKPLGVDCNVRPGHVNSVWLRLQGQAPGLHPVGRLDKDSHGLMLLSTDGTLTHALMHPSKQIAKTYHVSVRGPVTPERLHAFAQGPQYRVGPKVIAPRPCVVEVLCQTPDGALLAIQLTEGKNRQLRYMCRAVGWTVTDLQRVAIGDITLGSLPLDAIVPLDALLWARLQQQLQAKDCAGDEACTPCDETAF